MKHKIVLIVAYLAVMMATIGTVNAGVGVSVSPALITVVVGADGTHYVTVTTDKGTFNGNIELVGATDGNGNPIPFNLNPANHFTVRINGVETINPQLVGNGVDPVQTFAVTFTNNKGTPNGNYKLLYQADWTCSTGICTSGSAGYISAEASLIAIPEFPAVALPIATVIGLVFFFQRRNRNKIEE